MNQDDLKKVEQTLNDEELDNVSGGRGGLVHDDTSEHEERLLDN